MDYLPLKELSYRCLLDLATQEGINASAVGEAYGCIFGRDSAITVLKILRVCSKEPDDVLLEICRKSLLTLARLQGKKTNTESGEEPGKIIHEFRPNNYDRLIKRKKPWYVYPDGILRNYDSIDSTPLTLIAWYRYFEITRDYKFVKTISKNIDAALKWLTDYGDKDMDYFLEYELPGNRTHGGLQVQSWTDSADSIAKKNGQLPHYPIAPIEVQAYAWLAFRLWAHHFKKTHPLKAIRLLLYAKELKKQFNQKFIIKINDQIYGAQALDGLKRPIATPTANPLLCLWATYTNPKKGTLESIIDNQYIDKFVRRAFADDLFDRQAGIRTMSSLSATYNPDPTSYHNGSFWPVLNGMIHEGLVKWKFNKEAQLLKYATLKPILHFNTPIELYVSGKHGYQEFVSKTGKKGCRYQAWSSAAILDLVTDYSVVLPSNSGALAAASALVARIMPS